MPWVILQSVVVLVLIFVLVLLPVFVGGVHQGQDEGEED